MLAPKTETYVTTGNFVYSSGEIVFVSNSDQSRRHLRQRSVPRGFALLCVRYYGTALLGRRVVRFLLQGELTVCLARLCPICPLFLSCAHHIVMHAYVTPKQEESPPLQKKYIMRYDRSPSDCPKLPKHDKLESLWNCFWQDAHRKAFGP